MAIKRIVSNLPARQTQAAAAFYRDVLGMSVAMDLGWIVTFSAEGQAPMQISVATQGGSGTPLPAISIEVDNFDELYQRVRAAGFAIEYGPVDEPWGVRRFYVRDPLGCLVNILTHT